MDTAQWSGGGVVCTAPPPLKGWDTKSNSAFLQFLFQKKPQARLLFILNEGGRG